MKFADYVKEEEMWKKLVLRLKDNRFLKRLIVGVTPVIVSLLFFLYQLSTHDQKLFLDFSPHVIFGFIVYLIMMIAFAFISKQIYTSIFWSFPIIIILVIFGGEYARGNMTNAWAGVAVFGSLALASMASGTIYSIYMIYRAVKYLRYWIYSKYGE